MLGFEYGTASLFGGSYLTLRCVLEFGKFRGAAGTSRKFKHREAKSESSHP